MGYELRILRTCLIFAGQTFAALSLSGSLPAWAQSTISYSQEATLANSQGRFHKVSSKDTPSGFPVPRYVSLKVGTVNGRTGPSLGHAVAWQYRRRGLPLIVVAETDFWRKVRDIHGDESWIHKPALSGERTVLALQETALYRRPDENARIEATIAPQVLLKLENCNTQGWCKFKAPTGYKGWAQRQFFWGAAPL